MCECVGEHDDGEFYYIIAMGGIRVCRRVVVRFEGRLSEKKGMSGHKKNECIYNINVYYYVPIHEHNIFIIRYNLNVRKLRDDCNTIIIIVLLYITIKNTFMRL